ncbi:MAG: hypothetical protein II712_00375, partial [Erysipelotrichaceae bacterium]|nr:hypothetical protein [Erysipelotrichaceae bacterium]
GPDEVNTLVGKDSDRSLIEYLKALCEIRRKYRINHVELKNLRCENQRGILVQQLKNCEGRDITVIINPSDDEFVYGFEGERTLLLDKDGLNGSVVKDGYAVKPLSAAVLSGEHR